VVPDNRVGSAPLARTTASPNKTSLILGKTSSMITKLEVVLLNLLKNPLCGYQDVEIDNFWFLLHTGRVRGFSPGW
jgi:hypothetical protein